MSSFSELLYQSFNDNRVLHLLKSQGIDLNTLCKLPYDIVEISNYITIYVDIPGIDEESLEINVDNNNIIITGNRIPYYSTKSILVNNISYGKFSKTITLPISVTKKENVHVDTKNGVLIIVVDKLKESENKFKISLKN